MRRGRIDLVEAVQKLGFFVDVLSGQGAHADDGIHWRTDVMGHIGKKGLFGHIGAVSFFQSLLQFFHFFLLGVLV